MPYESVTSATDFGVVESISLPHDSRVPDPVTGTSTFEEYDRYFRIKRQDGDLADWSKTCLDLTEQLLDSLRDSSLEPSDQRDLLRGSVSVLSTTLTRWVDASNAAATEIENR